VLDAAEVPESSLAAPVFGLPLDVPVAAAPAGELPPARTWREGWSRAARNRLSVVGVWMLVVLLVLVLVGPFVWTVDPAEQNLTARLVAPSLEHPLSTDSNGRDMLSRLLNGGR